MATDSEILDGIENQFLVDGEQLATLRKYAAIARAIESRDWQLVPTTPTKEMFTESAIYADTSDWWPCVLQAAPQFQEEGNG